MRAEGLEPIPGSDGRVADVEEAAAVARELGYPVLLKADAGGGGKGMRRADDERALRAGYAAARAEAEAAFGDGGLYLERLIEGGRHVEVQVLADRYGSAVHLYERECSVQRNHQKLIEESPSPVLAREARSELGERAARAAAAIGYRGAGTLEFLRDPRGRVWFMEVNARLQVEHPVTELVTGVDIVAAQLRIAANHRLGLAQDALEQRGHAIEARVNAEDPAQGFRPSPGVLAAFELPADLGPGRVRVDTHLAAGDEIPPYYDSLIAKVIAHGATRAEAIETLARALRGARIEGVATTIPLHLAVLESAAFRRGEYDTSAIPGWPPSAVLARARELRER
jgi:acetyl-CoA carboxylase biotin carboxylase subunit